jgi:cbb3-type cytochrome oxidase maturation protein
MQTLIILIPITLMLAIIGLVAFLWSVKNKQYDDLDKEASKILFDNDKDEK